MASLHLSNIRSFYREEDELPEYSPMERTVFHDVFTLPGVYVHIA